jgi:hypothetical protein
LSPLGKSLKELAAAGDPFLDLAAALLPVREQMRETNKTREGARYRLIPRYMTALLEKSGGHVAPDANGTLRVTYGRVLGVDAKDGLAFKPQTTLAGIVEKQTGEGDFDAPRRELDAIQAVRAGRETPYLDPALRDVPVNFLSTVDTTGGNSGSATLNARGELCGLLFDGTFDTVDSDILYDPVHTRSIHVDSRYPLGPDRGGRRDAPPRGARPVGARATRRSLAAVRRARSARTRAISSTIGVFSNASGTSRREGTTREASCGTALVRSERGPLVRPGEQHVAEGLGRDHPAASLMNAFGRRGMREQAADSPMTIRPGEVKRSMRYE